MAEPAVAVSASVAARAVPAVSRAIAILRLLARSDAPLGVNAIARRLDLIPSTALHILRALAGEGLVAFDPLTKLYSLDAGVLTLARSALRQDGFSRLVQGELDRIAERFGITAIGVRVIGLQHMIVVAISRSEMMLRLHVDVGSRFPALISATGRCLAAFGAHDGAALARAFQSLRWDQAPTYATWQSEVAQARRLGYALDKGNYIRGVTIVAAPVMGIEGGMTHAIVAVALNEQVRADGLGVLGQEVRSAATRVTAQLGGEVD